MNKVAFITEESNKMKQEKFKKNETREIQKDNYNWRANRRETKKY